jgi:hypothetical protein
MRGKSQGLTEQVRATACSKSRSQQAFCGIQEEETNSEFNIASALGTAVQ